MSDSIRREWTAEEIAYEYDGTVEDPLIQFLAEATRVWAERYAYEQSQLAGMRNSLPPLKGDK